MARPSRGPARAGQCTLRRTSLARLRGSRRRAGDAVDRAAPQSSSCGFCRGSSSSRCSASRRSASTPTSAWWVSLVWLRSRSASSHCGRGRQRDLRAARRGLASAVVADAVLSSLCAAVAAARGVRVAVHGRCASAGLGRESRSRARRGRSRCSVRFPIRCRGSRSRASRCGTRASRPAGVPWKERALPVLGPDRLAARRLPIPRGRSSQDVKTLRCTRRPPVTFYLGTRRRVAVSAARAWSSFSKPAIRQPGRCSTWRSSGRTASLQASSSDRQRDWALVRAIPTHLSLPVLLDIDPAARGQGITSTLRLDLRLLRPKRAGDLDEPEPPVSLWPDPKALGTLTDLYELTMMAGYHAAGMADQKAPRSSCSCGSCRTTGRTWSSPGSSRRSATCSSWRSTRADRGDPPLAGISAVSSRVMDKLAATRFEGDVYSVPEGTVVFRGRDLAASGRPAAAGSVGRNALADLAWRIRPWSLPRRPGSSRWQAEDRSSSSAPGADTDRSPVCWQRGRLYRRLRRHQSRRGRTAAGHAGGRHHGPLVGPSFADRSRSVRDLRPGLSRKHHAAGRHLRHARRRSTAPRRSSRRFRRSESTAAISAASARAGSGDPRRVRRAEREDRRLGRSRRIQDRRARRIGCADRRLRGRNRD